MAALRTHYVDISQHADNSDGSLSVTAIARRSGIMRYRSDSGDRLEFVPPELIDARDDQGRPVMGMLAGAPNTNEHPAQIIRYSTDSRKAVQVGKVNEEIHIFNDADGERSVKVRFDVSDPETIEDIRSGRKKGVSLGYLCNVVREDGEYRGQKYTHKQAMPFSIDHLAIVANPRNPGALITRFDSDDIAVISMDSARSPLEVIRVDGCCAACSAKSDDDEDEEQETKDKKVKTDAEEMPMIPIIFAGSIQDMTVEQAQGLWMDGTIDRVRLDGADYFMAADMALTLADQGIIHEDAFVARAGIAKGGGTCGRGWVGVKGSCKRLAKGADRAGAQKSALKEFAQGQRVKGLTGKAVAPIAKTSTSTEEKITKLRTKLEGKANKASDQAMKERLKNGKTDKYYALSASADKLTGHTENLSMNPKVADGQKTRYAKRNAAVEKTAGMKGVSEAYEKGLKEKATQAIQKSIDRKGHKNYKEGKEGVRPDWSSASTLSRGGEVKSKKQAQEASDNHYTKRR